MCNLSISTSFLLLAVILLAKSVESKPDLRIIGGNEASAAQFPCAAAVYSTIMGASYFCGGSVISKDWILTAGQCVHNATKFTILLGSNSLSTNGDKSVKVTSTTHVLHPEYNPDSLKNDIGLIKLETSLTYTDYISPINYKLNLAVTDDMPLTAIGWGQASNEAGLQDKLHYTTAINYISNDDCMKTFGSHITEKMMCVKGSSNQGTCYGDIGGPLIYQYLSSFYQIGIASFISGNGCESTDPSGFTRITPYRDWIINATSSS